jgi:hypothetical protein
MVFTVLLTNPYLLLPFILTLISAVYSKRRKRVTLPDLPWINRDPDLWFSKLRARIWTTLKYKDAIQYAYEKVGKCR